MMTRQAVRPVMLALVGALATASACAPLEGVAQPTSRSNAVVQGEVRSLDARRGRVQVREDHGRTHTLRYDNRTRVTYGSRQYPVSSLERGDYVRIRVTHDRGGTAWADRIEVRDSRANRRGSVAGRVERVSGRVANVDTRRGYFTLEQSRTRLVVHVPRRASSSDARRFDRLRRGDRVSVEVRPLGRNEVELVRFR